MQVRIKHMIMLNVTQTMMIAYLGETSQERMLNGWKLTPCPGLSIKLVVFAKKEENDLCYFVAILLPKEGIEVK